MDIYDRISYLLSESNKTRKQMCSDLEISYHTMNSLYQRRTERMPLEMVQRIAKYLNSNVDYIAFGDEKPTISAKNEIEAIIDSLSVDKQTELLKYAKYLKNN